ncbi:putative quinol monooxygenase [Streptomyces sp. NPDC090442]|uniref:putative quinol monooxygenase n=1 Tax=Streptomyces sp. NPDC090442 TaxID=3365962 RepID=UPI00381A4CFD
MILIAVKYRIRPEHSANWLTRVDDFTKATRAEQGNVFFEWSRSADDPHGFVLLEAFAGPDAYLGLHGGRPRRGGRGHLPVPPAPAVVAQAQAVPQHCQDPVGRGGETVGRVRRIVRRRTPEWRVDRTSPRPVRWVA